MHLDLVVNQNITLLNIKFEFGDELFLILSHITKFLIHSVI